MKNNEISFQITLDDNNLPEEITWKATQKPADAPAATKAVSVSLWDDISMNSMRVDLWTKDMTVEEMKRFFINNLGGMAQMVLNATGDEFMAGETNALCERLIEHLNKEEGKK